MKKLNHSVLKVLKLTKQETMSSSNQCWEGLPLHLKELFNRHIALRVGGSLSRTVPNGSYERLTIIKGGHEDFPPFLDPLVEDGYPLCRSDVSGLPYLVRHLDTVGIGNSLQIAISMQKAEAGDVWRCWLPVFACNGDSNLMYLEVNGETAEQIRACAGGVMQYLVSTIPLRVAELVTLLEVVNLPINGLRIGHFHGLTWVDLEHCELTEVPEGLEQLENLVLLHLQHNRLTRLGGPLLFARWPYINEVDVSANNIAYLGMKSTGDTPVTVYVDDNPIVGALGNVIIEDECGHLDVGQHMDWMFRPVRDAADALAITILWYRKRGLMGLNRQFPCDVVRLFMQYVCATSHCEEWLRCLRPEAGSEKKHRVEVLDDL